MARLSSEEFISSTDLHFMDSIFLLFWTCAIFPRSYDWSQISRSMLLTDRDLSIMPLNCRVYWSESKILWKARSRFLTVFYDALLPCLLFNEVGHVREKPKIQPIHPEEKLPALEVKKYRNHLNSSIKDLNVWWTDHVNVPLSLVQWERRCGNHMFMWVFWYCLCFYCRTVSSLLSCRQFNTT